MGEKIPCGRKHQRGSVQSGFNNVEIIQKIPNFREIGRYREFLSIELENLLSQEESGVFKLCSFDVREMIQRCNLQFRNPNNLASIITENGIYGKLSSDLITINLTKEGLYNLDKLLASETLENFINKNLLTEADFVGGKTNTTILTIGRMIRQRGFDQLTGVPGSKFVYNAFEEMEVGVDYNVLNGDGKDKTITMRILPPGIEKLINHVSLNIRKSILPKHSEP